MSVKSLVARSRFSDRSGREASLSGFPAAAGRARCDPARGAGVVRFRLIGEALTRRSGRRRGAWHRTSGRAQRRRSGKQWPPGAGRFPSATGGGAVDGRSYSQASFLVPWSPPKPPGPRRAYGASPIRPCLRCPWHQPHSSAVAALSVCFSQRRSCDSRGPGPTFAGHNLRPLRFPQQTGTEGVEGSRRPATRAESSALRSVGATG